LLVGLALLSMAAGARHGLPAPTTVVPPASVGSVSAELPARAVSMPAGFMVSLADARDAVLPTAIGSVGAGSDLANGHTAPLAPVVSTPESLGRQEPSTARQPHIPLTVLHAIVPATLGSRAPPTA
jgi:hypothetical protein